MGVAWKRGPAVCPCSETPRLDRLELGQGGKKRYSNRRENFRHQVARLRAHSPAAALGSAGLNTPNKGIPPTLRCRPRRVHRLCGSVHSLCGLHRTKTVASPGAAEGRSRWGARPSRSPGGRDVVCFLPSLCPWGPSSPGAHQPSSPFQYSPMP